ncbi:hypothetical protein OpiT1DRAFT_01707 [Opitutaceae bacterium TAV1]|nr:hypothetical protein OpiT1DRAFT_01707 [Opitutaceae bacterium TAV1]
MNNTDYIPRKESVFHTWQETFAAYLLANMTRFGFTTEVLENLMALQATWRDAWDAANNPATRTKAAIDTKDAALAAYKAGIRAFVNEYLTYNHKVTVADRDNMGLPIHDTEPTPVPVPQTVPQCTVTMPVARRLAIAIGVAGHPRRKKEEGAHGTELRWVISETQPASLDQFLHSEFVTHSPLLLDFDESQRGKRIWFIARWENTRGQKGPWTEMFSAIIP